MGFYLFIYQFSERNEHYPLSVCWLVSHLIPLVLIGVIQAPVAECFREYLETSWQYFLVDNPCFAIIEHHFTGSHQLINTLKLCISKFWAQKCFQSQSIIYFGDIFTTLTLKVGNQLIFADYVLTCFKSYLKILKLLWNLYGVERYVSINNQLLQINLVK